MAGLTGVREALAEAVGRMVGGRAYAYMPDQIAVGPHGAAVVGIDPGARVIERLTFDRTVQYTLFVRVFAPSASAEEAQRLLDARISRTGPDSVWRAIEEIPATGEIEYAEVRGVSNYGESELSQGGARYLSADLEVIVVESAS